MVGASNAPISASGFPADRRNSASTELLTISYTKITTLPGKYAWSIKLYSHLCKLDHFLSINSGCVCFILGYLGLNDVESGKLLSKPYFKMAEQCVFEGVKTMFCCYFRGYECLSCSFDIIIWMDDKSLLYHGPFLVISTVNISILRHII